MMTADASKYSAAIIVRERERDTDTKCASIKSAIIVVGVSVW